MEDNKMEEPLTGSDGPGREKHMEQAEAEQAGAEQAEAEQAGAEQAEAEQAGAEQTEAEQAETEQAEPEQAGAEEAGQAEPAAAGQIGAAAGARLGREALFLQEDAQLAREERQFEEELAQLMKADPAGKGKKRKGNREGRRETRDKGERKPCSKKRKIIVAAIAAAIVIGGGFKVFGGKQEQAVMVSTTPLAKGAIKEELTISGPVSGTDSVDVVSNLHAQVKDIRVKEGDRVEAGQLLAVIDDSDVRKEVDMAQNAYDLAVSTCREQQILAENGYARAVEAEEAARKEFDRTSVLYQSGSVSLVEWETSRDKLREARRQVRAFPLKDGKAVANESYSLQVKNAEFELEKKKALLEDTQAVSPIAGTVVRVNAKVGRFADKIEGDKPMFIIENLEVLEMKVSVSEYSIGKIQIGQEAAISADILNGRTVKGRVTAISPTGEEKGGGSTERVIPITIQIMEDHAGLIAGITARARIVLSEAEDAWIVPISSVMETEEGLFVLAVEEGAIKRVPVKTGVESDIQVQVFPVEEGALKEEMRIVTTPAEHLTEGLKVVEDGAGK